MPLPIEAYALIGNNCKTAALLLERLQSVGSTHFTGGFRKDHAWNELSLCARVPGITLLKTKPAREVSAALLDVKGIAQ